MLDIVEQILGYLRGLWRQRWYSLIIAWAVCLGGWLVVLNIPDKYPAETRVFVDTETILKPLLQGLVVNNDTQSQVRVMTRTLLSRPNLRKVARMTDLDLRAETARELERLLDDMEENIRIQSSGGQNLFTITYTDFDPEQAKSVVQALLTLFVESTIGETREDTESAERFLRRKIEDIEEQLRQSERRMAQFKRQNVGTMPSDGQTYYQRLQQTRSEMELAELGLEQSKRTRDEYERQLGGEKPSFGVFTSVDLRPGGDPLSGLRKNYGIAIPDGGLRSGVDVGASSSSALEQQIQALLLSYTPNHPNVIAARRRLADVRAQESREAQSKAEREAALAASQPATSNALPPPVEPALNPVYQATKLAFNDAQAQVAAREVRVEEYKKKVEELERLLSVVPAIEAEMADMNRDYSVTSKMYQALLSKLQSARMSQDAEQNADNVKFRVIDPPRVPHTPAGIDRAILLSMVLGVGTVVAIGFALFLSQIFLTFDSRKQLMRTTRIPVFGTVSLVLTPRQQLSRWVSLLVFLLFVAGLLVVFAMLIQAETGATTIG